MGRKESTHKTNTQHGRSTHCRPVSLALDVGEGWALFCGIYDASYNIVDLKSFGLDFALLIMGSTMASARAVIRRRTSAVHSSFALCQN